MKSSNAHTRALDFGQELVVDLFAGAGGASAGIGAAYREPDVAVNHDPIAIAVHRINHPTTEHFTCDVFEVDPLLATRGRPVGVLWASPDCRHHSKAKGGKPRSKRVRGLAWVVIKWAAACKPRLIHLENVEEFADWGPLLANGQPCPTRKGMTYRRWTRQLEKLGYKAEAREIIAADHGAPTTRKRLYVIARRDGLPIVWPAATFAKAGARGLTPWRTAAECIDFDLPTRSIFGRKRELAHNTKKRIAKGLWRYVLNTPKPFIVPLRGTGPSHTSTHAVADPLCTVAAGGTHHALVTPYLTEHANSSTQRTFAADEPLRTQMAQVKGGHFALVAPTIMSTSHSKTTGRGPNAWAPEDPLRTVDASGGGFAVAGATLIEAAHSDISPSGVRRWGSGVKDLNAPMGTVHAGGGNFALAAAHVTKFRTGATGCGADEPMPTVCSGGDMARPAGAAHALGLVSAHLTAFGQNAQGSDLREPCQTILAGATRYGITSAWMEQANTDMVGHAMTEPVSTIVGKGCTQRFATAYLVKYYGQGGQWSAADEPMGAVTTKARMGLVECVQVDVDTIAPELRERAKACADFLREYLPEHFTEVADMVLVGDYVLVDITLRMLVPRELARAQGFPDAYVIDRGAFEQPDGSIVIKPITKTAQVRLIGNSVCPDVAHALIRANAAELIELYARAA